MSFNQTAKQVTAAIVKIDAKKLRGDIQRAIVQVIGHAMEHGSSPLVETLTGRMDSVPMLRKLAPMVSTYLKAHGPFVYSKDAGWQFSKARKATLIEAGYDFATFETECPMWDDVAKATPKVEPLDLFKELEKLVAKAERRVPDGTVVSADLVPYIKALMGQYAGRKAVESAQTTAAIAAELNRIDGETVAA
jgi:hypothetical protein